MAYHTIACHRVPYHKIPYYHCVLYPARQPASNLSHQKQFPVDCQALKRFCRVANTWIEESRHSGSGYISSRPLVLGGGIFYVGPYKITQHGNMLTGDLLV